MSVKIRLLIAISIVFIMQNPAISGPITTVPWNGHPGAVSFTFDDGLASHVNNVFPNLTSRNIAATFFVYHGNSYSANRSVWITAAQNGQEVTNHTASHPNLPDFDSTRIETEVTGWATTLRAASSYFPSLTIAYPNCAENALVDRITDRQHFIARKCDWPGIVALHAQPASWMKMPALPISDNATITEAHTRIDQAARDTSWLITLNHGISGDWLSIPTDSLNHLFDHAITKNLWISTFEKVGAYFRSSFTMNAVTPVSTTNGWDVSWTLPHPKLPASIPLRIKLDQTYFARPITVYQGGVKIASQADGSYSIDFAKLNLTIFRGDVTAAFQNGLFNRSARLPIISSTGNSLKVSSLQAGRYHVSIFSPNGTRIQSREIRIGDEESASLFPLGIPQSVGPYVVTIQDKSAVIISSAILPGSMK
jgi:peptidoglycan/xylan/chitin deacetylase (PgdA/CDA1 family)